MSLLSCCAAVVLVLAVVLSGPFGRWAVPKALHYSMLPGSEQRRWKERHPPSLHSNEVSGLAAPAFVADNRMDFLLHNFTHRPGDVWVTTYAKVGTTWTQYIVTQILGYRPVTGTSDIFAVSPWPEAAHGIIATSEEQLQLSASDDRFGKVRVFKSHWPRRDYIAQLPKTSKIIYVYRNVEKVAVSFFHHILNLFFIYMVEPEEMTWDMYFEKFISGDLDFGDYFEHVASWWKVRDSPNVLMLRFEELTGDPQTSVRRIADFIGAPLDDERVSQVVEATSLKMMKKWSEGTQDRIFKFFGAVRGDHIRGGGAEKLLSASQRERLVKRFDEVLRPLGVPFEHFFT